MRTIKFPKQYDERALIKWAAFCEFDFSRRLFELSDLIVQAKKPFIALSGPSCSGKTTASHKLVADLTESGRRVKVISLDDFYLPRAQLLTRAARQGGKIDFDSPDTLDWTALRAFVEAIRRGEGALLPQYDFKKGEQVAYETVMPEAYDLYLFEGIQAAYPEFLSMLPSGDYSAIFVSVESGLKVEDQILRPRQLRLARRIVRDRYSRGASPEFTLSLWETVIANENAHIMPTRKRAHFHLDTLIGYELSVLREPLLDAIATLPEQAITPDVRTLLHFCERIPTLPREIVPENALLREFIG